LHIFVLLGFLELLLVGFSFSLDLGLLLCKLLLELLLLFYKLLGSSFGLLNFCLELLSLLR